MKDRFPAKRLRTVADKLVAEKRAIIEEKSAFKSLLNVSPFNIPNEIIDYVAQHTSPALREFKVGKKRIVFTRDMVMKVFAIRSGPKPVVSLKRSEHSNLCDVYKGANPRPDIPMTIKVLTECDATDEDTIIRSRDLLCMATVVDPRSSNHVGMDYLGSMSDPSKTHEYAWDEYILDLATKEVKKMHKKRVKPLVLKGGASKFEYWISGPFAILGIVYMDHLQFPSNNYVMDYSLPRACHVKCSDFEFAVVNDLDRLSLNSKKVFGRHLFLDITKTPYAIAVPEPVEDPEVNPSASLNEWLVFRSQELEVPECYKLLHEKHTAMFASDVDVATKNFAVGLKQMYFQQMLALLNDVDAALNEGDGPSVTFPSDGDMRTDETANGDVRNNQEAAAKQGQVHEDGDKENDVPEVESDEYDLEDDEVPEAESEEDESEEDDEMLCAAKVGTVQSRRATSDVPQSAVMTDTSCLGGDIGEQQTVGCPMRSPSPRSPYPSGIPKGISEEAWRRAPDPPPMELFSQDPDETMPDDAAPVENIVAASSDKLQATEVLSEVAMPLKAYKDVQVNEDATSDVRLDKDVAMAELGELVTPIEPKSTCFYDHSLSYFVGVVIIDSNSKDATSGPDTHAKKNSKEFVRIGRYFCSYKSFHDSLKPQQYLSSEDKLIVDPVAFDVEGCMKELKNVNSKFKIYMENFHGKLMSHFDNNAIPDHRRLVPVSLIDNRDNGNDVVESIMDEEMIKSKKN
ncbi:hypothetical protein ACQ4PT_064933 [Festuca glaucescens]